MNDQHRRMRLQVLLQQIHYLTDGVAKTVQCISDGWVNTIKVLMGGRVTDCIYLHRLVGLRQWFKFLKCHINAVSVSWVDLKERCRQKYKAMWFSESADLSYSVCLFHWTRSLDSVVLQRWQADLDPLSYALLGPQEGLSVPTWLLSRYSSPNCPSVQQRAALCLHINTRWAQP